MDEEPSAWRFFALLNLFMFAMLTLVLGDNLLVMFVGWEGVGLCSWALIGFWYSERANTNAGNKAFIVNRIGDFSFVLGMFPAVLDAGRHGPRLRGVPQARRERASPRGRDGLGLAGRGGGRPVPVRRRHRQVRADPALRMVARRDGRPDTVSALIHAATMVTAGVYMIGRMNFVYSMAPQALEVVAWVGAITAFFAATIGLAQNDIKKVLAYSTVSQLGYMFLAMGVGAYAAGIFT
jgi:NADH-quinone oxidoreductase subunit L